jgi:outer membrane protein assembly factor BamB
MKLHTLTAIFLLVLSQAAFSQEWTRFRGPNGSGVSSITNIPVQITPSDYAWKITLPGGGHSSPVLWGDRIFLTCAEKETATRMVICISANDGHTLWTKSYPSKPYKMNPDNSYAAASPVVDENRVYVCWSTPEDYSLLALTHDGQEVWKADLGPYKSQHGSGASPIVFQNLVILTNDNEGQESYIAAFDRVTGQRAWKLPRKSERAAASTPCIYQPAGQPAQLIVTSKSEGVTAINPTNGEKLWALPDLFDFRVVASPIAWDNFVLANDGEGAGGKRLVAIHPGTAEKKAEVAWRIVDNVPYVPCPLEKDGKLFLWHDNGTVLCREAATGKLLWQGRVMKPDANGKTAPALFYGSPVWTDGKLYNMSRKGDLFVVSAGDKFEQLACNPLGELSHATPALANGHMYLRTYTHLICVARKP